MDGTINHDNDGEIIESSYKDLDNLQKLFATQKIYA